ncbi:MAG: hypothetical protein GY796_26915 [Chloroflexi bacterium]|nr:hypothetical protein [Chloroflexota bacterium]
MIIDDQREIGELLSMQIRVAKCQAEIVTNPSDVLPAIEAAEIAGEPFSAATVDIRFELSIGDEKIDFLQGPQIVGEIKAKYPEIGCLIVTGETLSPSQALDLRDEFGVDYIYIKDRFEPNEFVRAIKRAVDVALQVTRSQSLSVQSERKPEYTLEKLRQTETAVSKGKLHQVLVENFSEQELRELCFNFDLRYEELSGTSIREKALELLTYFDRRGRIDELIAACVNLRPHVFAK